MSWAWWHMPRKEDLDFKASLDYRVRPCLKHKKEKKRNGGGESRFNKLSMIREASHGGLLVVF
jgi:hypothetical protein